MNWKINISLAYFFFSTFAFKHLRNENCSQHYSRKNRSSGNINKRKNGRIYREVKKTGYRNIGVEHGLWNLFLSFSSRTIRTDYINIGALFLRRASCGWLTREINSVISFSLGLISNSPNREHREIDRNAFRVCDGRFKRFKLSRISQRGSARTSLCKIDRLDYRVGLKQKNCQLAASNSSKMLL